MTRRTDQAQPKPRKAPGSTDQTSSFTTFPSPVFSLWQSAVHEVLAQRAAAAGTLGGAPATLSSNEPIMLQSVAAAQAIISGQAAPDAAVLGVADCAQLYLQLIVAEATHNTQRVAEVNNEIAFSNCDPLWAAVLLEYEKFRLQSGQIPYRSHQQLSDYVLPLPAQNPAEVRIALIADWGTGTEPARQLLANAAQRAPDVLIHLGDIYYSGTSQEMQERFLAVCRATPGLNIPIYTLAGNHDMYSGGVGYYWLIDQLHQPASYFCLRNDDWQLLAMDTGLHDNDPGTVISNLTYLDEREAAWHRDKITNAGGRRTILLSHHQLFSAAAAVGASDGKPLAVNPHLYTAFADLLGEVALWLWGHEHNLIVFDEYAGLARGRCIGSAAIPTMLDQQPYAPNPNLVIPTGQTSPPLINENVRLADNGQFYSHGYALLTLKGRAATVQYYQVRDDGSGELLYEETC
jgi:predicted phosphodiesterase